MEAHRDVTDPRDILSYWLAVELLSPITLKKCNFSRDQIVSGKKKPQSGVTFVEDMPLSRVEEYLRDKLPTLPLRSVRAKDGRTTRHEVLFYEHTIYCGVFPIDTAVKKIQNSLADTAIGPKDRPTDGSVPSRAGETAVAAIQIAPHFDRAHLDNYLTSNSLRGNSAAFGGAPVYPLQQFSVVDRELSSLAVCLSLIGSEASSSSVTKLADRFRKVSNLFHEKRMLESYKQNSEYRDLTLFNSTPWTKEFPTTGTLVDLVRATWAHAAALISLTEIPLADNEFHRPESNPTVRIKTTIQRFEIEEVHSTPSTFNWHLPSPSKSLEFLNSLYIEPLQRALNALNPPPSQLSPVLATLLSNPPAQRIDIMKGEGEEILRRGVSAAAIPVGRWPGNPKHGLSLRQQFAVNRSLGTTTNTEGECLFGVNGPPGTGKTTMLRDIIAQVTVNRAIKIAALQSAADAIDEMGLKPDLWGDEIVIASSNNAAVENVSLEIPSLDSIWSEWQNEDSLQKHGYFLDHASLIFDAVSTKQNGSSQSEGTDPSETKEQNRSSWGLLSARLGNKSNIAQFRNALWKRLDDGDCFMYEIKRSRVRSDEWKTAQKSFIEQLNKVRTLIEERKTAEVELANFSQYEEQRDALSIQIDGIQEHYNSCREELQSCYRKMAEEKTTHDVYKQRLKDIHEAKPSCWKQISTFFYAWYQWNRAVKEAKSQLNDAKNTLNNTDKQCKKLKTKHGSAKNTLVRVKKQLKETTATLCRLEELKQELGVHFSAENSDSEASDDNRPTAKEREISSPWIVEELNKERSLLMFHALRLHEAAIRANGSAVYQTLSEFLKDPTKASADQWRLFFFVVPVVSTTFASLGRLFAKLESEDLGWLIVDEAGQTSPAHAISGLARARRAIAVGDPLQLEPVVTIPERLDSALARAFGVDFSSWGSSHVSLQQLVDRVQRIGTQSESGGGLWLGMPLVVHRRCEEPMFSICNEIAYDGRMLSQVLPNEDSDLPSSRWIHVEAKNKEEKVQVDEISKLRELLASQDLANLDMNDVIVISPFREVADRIKALINSLAKDNPRFKGLQGGTIHTAQGKEAKVVFFVLGGRKDGTGEKMWASSKVNLVNVAVSRAKERLYVIGDCTEWRRHPYFNTLFDELQRFHSRAIESTRSSK